jgi:hypothetical protein
MGHDLHQSMWRDKYQFHFSLSSYAEYLWYLRSHAAMDDLTLVLAARR